MYRSECNDIHYTCLINLSVFISVLIIAAKNQTITDNRKQSTVFPQSDESVHIERIL